jgi:hypothetical protein
MKPEKDNQQSRHEPTGVAEPAIGLSIGSGTDPDAVAVPFVGHTVTDTTYWSSQT